MLYTLFLVLKKNKNFFHLNIFNYLKFVLKTLNFHYFYKNININQKL